MLGPLIESIKQQKDDNEPYILLMGAGCSVSSGCPSAKELAKIIVDDNDLKWEIDETTLERAGKLLGDRILNNNLVKQFSNTHPSKGYWFLAELIRKGYFNLIFTTNYDTCLEKALVKVINYDDFDVLVRGDVDDKRINELINLATPRIKIIKLHGDYRSKNMVVAPEDLWNIGDPLKETLTRKIAERGMLIIGVSMHDSSIIETLPRNRANNFWYVNPDPPDDITKNILRGRGIGEDHWIQDKQGAFDEFFSSLSVELGKKNGNKKNAFDKERIEETYAIQEVSRDKLRSDLDRLCLKINKADFDNLVFIHDPDAPGGSELYKLIRTRGNDIVQGKNVYELHIEGRGEKERKAERPAIIRPGSKKSLDKDARYLLVDSVSFSGRTLEICAESIKKEWGENVTIGAAVIYYAQPLAKKVQKKDYVFHDDFLYVRLIDVHQILFPWGLTQATESIFSEELAPDTIDEYVPHKAFSFLPRPWGSIISMVENKLSTVKILSLNPREMLSKHKHFVRDEIFFVLDARVLLQVWDEYILLRKGDSFRIPAGTEHRFIGLDEPCRLLEISQKYHDQIDDIFRIEDKYRRVGQKGDV
jgi:mannose-6-phosphate isomerase-like protein (cupin superfamily)